MGGIGDENGSRSWIDCLREKEKVHIKNGDSETRTRDLYVANVSLSQLSYIPMQIIIAFSLKNARGRQKKSRGVCRKNG